MNVSAQSDRGTADAQIVDLVGDRGADRGRSASQDELQLGNDQMAADSRNPLQSKPARTADAKTGSEEGGRGGARPAGGSGGGSGSGSTLFERMAGLTRGTEKSPAADEGAPGMDIPRFLNRQNNQ